jgi:cation transport regulator ChaC
MDGSLWIFAYGSLIWRPDFEFGERRPGFIEGWSRRFWQGSVDHRGVPAAPGRVVTLAREPGERCWGVVYRVAAQQRAAVLDNLDHRERGGFDRCEVEVRFDSSDPDSPDPGSVAAITYVAPPTNPNYLGPASMAAIAEQVRGSHGPSGSNAEYALRLAESLEGLGVEDDHVFELAAKL